MPYGMWPPAFRWWGDEEEPAEETKGKALEVGGGQRESPNICDLYKELYANFFFFFWDKKQIVCADKYISFLFSGDKMSMPRVFLLFLL